MLELIIRKRKIVLLFLSMLFLIGIITLFQLPRREIPETELPLATVTTIYPGARAELVEKYVTDRIEGKLSGITEITEITSLSRTGFSRIVISLDEGTDKDRIWNLVRQRLKEAEVGFPEGVNEPIFNDDLNMQGISLYQIIAGSEEELYQLSSTLDYWEKRVLQIPGISRVSIQGIPEREVIISINAEIINHMKIPLIRVLDAVGGEINIVAPGQWELYDHQYQLRADSYKEVAELEELIILRTNTGELVKLGDVATVKEGYKPLTQLVNYQCQPSVSVSFFLSPGFDILNLDRQITILMDEMQSQLPASVSIVKIYSQAEPVQQLFVSLATAFLIAMLIVLLICTLGFNLLTAFSVVLAIPLSLSLGIIAAPLLGVDLNQITLIAFIIVLGILVDDSIVVNENIERHLLLGQDPLLATVNGTKEVMSSVITSTVIIVFTFFPLMFLSGASGAFIRPLPVVITFSIIASTIVALSLIPIYRYHLAKKHTAKSTGIGHIGKVLDQVADYYAFKIVPVIIKRPKYVSLMIIIGSLSMYLLIPFIPLEFFPDTEREEIFIEMKLPESTCIEKTKIHAQIVQEWISAQEEVREVSGFIGTPVPRLFGMTSSQGNEPNNAMFLVYIDRDKALASEMKDKWNSQLIQEFPYIEFNSSVIEAGPPIGAPIALRLKGDSNDKLGGIAQEVKALLAKQPGINSVSDDAGKPLATLDFQPRRAALQEWGISKQAVTQILRLYGEGLPIGEFSSQNTLLDMRVTYEFEKGTPMENINNIYLLNSRGESVSLSSLVDISTDFTIQNISHHNYTPSITVRGYMDSDAKVDKVLSGMRSELNLIMSEYPDCQLEIAGETSARNEVFVEIGKIFILVVFLVLIAMAIQFYSLLIPLLILSTVLLGTSGAILVLFITQTGLGFMSMMGIVSLAGITVRNGIILIEFIEQKRRNGLPLSEAVQEACQSRLKPIVLTSTTTILGLMPLIFSGILLFKPLAISIAGGLIFSALLTLLLVPALYVSCVRFLPE